MKSGTLCALISDFITRDSDTFYVLYSRQFFQINRLLIQLPSYFSCSSLLVPRGEKSFLIRFLFARLFLFELLDLSTTH